MVYVIILFLHHFLTNLFKNYIFVDSIFIFCWLSFTITCISVMIFLVEFFVLCGVISLFKFYLLCNITFSF